MFVVIAAYNEAPVIASVVADVRRTSYPVVLVDDGSIDETGEIAARAGAFVVTHPVNLGQGAALQTGIDFALAQGADVIVTFDADGQHRAADIADADRGALARTRPTMRSAAAFSAERSTCRANAG